MAHKVIDFLQPKIKSYYEYKQQQDADNKILNLKTVPVLDLDGNTYDVSVSTCLDGNTHCLICGGSTYHTHLSCFKNWPVKMRNNFKGWEIITIEDAEKQHLKKCSFCNENDKLTLNDILKELDSDDICDDELEDEI